MAKKKTQQVNPTFQRLENIEMAIRELQEQLNQTKTQMTTLDRMMLDLEEIKRNTKRKRGGILGKLRKEPEEEENKMMHVTSLLKNPMLQSWLKKSGKMGSGIDLAGIASLLQEPMVQSMLNSKQGKGKPTKAGNPTPPGMPDMLQFFQNPGIQALLKNIK